MKKHLTEAVFNSNKIGKVQFTDRNLTPTDIEKVAFGYYHIPRTKIVKGNKDNLIRIANDLAKLTGGKQQLTGLQSGNKAMILFLLKHGLVNAAEYKDMYKTLVELHKDVVKKLKTAKGGKGKAGAKGAATHDMENENITEAPEKLNYVGHAFKGNKIVDRTATKSYDDKVFKPFISGNEKAGNTVVIDAFDWKTKKIIRQVYKTKGGKDWNPKTEETHMNESLKKLKKSIELGSGKKGSYYVDKVGFDTNGNWSYMVSRGSNKAKKIQHQGDWGTKITKDSDWKEVENSKVAQNIINYYEKFVKESVNETISQSEKYKVYNTLKKGDEVEMDRRDGFKTYVVTKGKTILGKQKVERISLVLKDKPRAVKYYLYNRNKNIGLAIGDGASPLIDIRKSVNEANPKISMNNLDWGKSTAERNANLDKYKSLKTTWGKNEFLKKLKGESVNETTFSIKYDNKSYSIDATDAEEAKKLGVQKFQIPMSKWTRLKITAESVNEAKSDFVARYSGTTITIKGARKKYSDDDLDKLYDILGKSIAKQKIKAKSVVVTAESINEEKVYIDYMDKKKGFATTRKKFNSMSAAIKWGKKNLNDDEFHPFNSDMIRFEMDEAVQTKSLKHFKKLKKQGVDVKLSTKADLNKEKVAEGKFEPDVIEDLRDIVKHKQNKKIKDPKTGKQMRVDLFTAGAIIKVYDAINQKNKASFVTVGIPKMAGMAFKLLK